MKNLAIIFLAISFFTLTIVAQDNVEVAKRNRISNQKIELKNSSDQKTLKVYNNEFNSQNIYLNANNAQIEDLGDRFGVTTNNSQVEELGERFGLTTNNSQVEELGERFGLTTNNSQVEELGERFGLTTNNSQVEELGERFGLTTNNSQVED